MKKSKIYALAVFYQQRILGVDSEKPIRFAFSDARYFRDQFGPIQEKGAQIEKDRVEIMESKKIKDKEKELKKLFDEEVKIKLDKDIVSRLEKAKVELTINETTLFE
jgi:hypothetical protein